MNLTIQDLAALIVPLGTIIVLFWIRLERRINQMEDRVERKINKIEDRIEREFKETHRELMNIYHRIGRLEGYFVKAAIIPFQEDKPKKKAKGE